MVVVAVVVVVVKWERAFSLEANRATSARFPSVLLMDARVFHFPSTFLKVLLPSSLVSLLLSSGMVVVVGEVDQVLSNAILSNLDSR